MHLDRKEPFQPGLTVITDLDRKDPEIGIRFAVLRLGAGQSFSQTLDLECAWLLIHGSVSIAWNGSAPVTMTRSNCFDDKPWVLHVPAGSTIQIEGLAPDSELAMQATANPTLFDPNLYRPDDIADEERGKGTLGETSTRLVRTVFDTTRAPAARLVLGEVVAFPGKWSSYPPHHHPQPEIYYYRFWPEHGYGHCELGDTVIKVHHNSTALISPGLVHPQTAAPGYAMWYLWVIRHLPDDPYIQPVFLPEHLWVNRPDAVIWPDKPR